MGEVMFDLLGDPIPEGRGKPGRTGHIATAQDVSRVRELLVAGLTKARIAKELGLSVPTLNKLFFASGKINTRHAREMAVAEQRAKTLLQLGKAAGEGNVSAMKVMLKELDRVQVELLDDRVTHPERPKAKRPLGKKEQDREAAAAAELELERRYGRPN